MKFTVAILACIVAAASAQYNAQYGKYDPFNQFGFQNRKNQFPYKPYTTPAPYRTYRPVSPVVTIAPSVYSTPAPVYSTAAPVAYAKISSDARNAETVRYGNEAQPDGSFNYYYETNNGIAAQAQGVPRDFGGNPPVVPVVIQGSYSYTSPEGKTITINYNADENGFQPSGDALPTPPALPPQIARALAYTAKYVVPQKK